jgi:hypothetical protein
MHIVGIPEREYFDKMVDLRDRCEELEIGVPEAVTEFFGPYHRESAACLESEVLFQKVDHREWSNEHSSGFEVDVKNISKNIKTIRFYCSW